MQANLTASNFFGASGCSSDNITQTCSPSVASACAAVGGCALGTFSPSGLRPCQDWKRGCPAGQGWAPGSFVSDARCTPCGHGSWKGVAEKASCVPWTDKLALCPRQALFPNGTATSDQGCVSVTKSALSCDLTGAVTVGYSTVVGVVAGKGLMRCTLTLVNAQREPAPYHLEIMFNLTHSGVWLVQPLLDVSVLLSVSRYFADVRVLPSGVTASHSLISCPSAFPANTDIRCTVLARDGYQNPSNSLPFPLVMSVAFNGPTSYGLVMPQGASEGAFVATYTPAPSALAFNLSVAVTLGVDGAASSVTCNNYFSVAGSEVRCSIHTKSAGDAFVGTASFIPALAVLLKNRGAVPP